MTIMQSTLEAFVWVAIDVAKDRPFRGSTAQNIELVTKNEDFGLQRRPRPE